MISTEKLEPLNINESNAVNTAKANKWNEQPHIGKYKLIKTIGKGNFAKVKLAQHVTTGKKVAVKVIDKTALNNSSLQKLFREVKIMKTIDHPNIVKLFEVIESERHVYLVMEYASRGEVFDYLVQNGRMKEKDARLRFREIVSAIQYCHQKQIVHRDLKAENLLLSSDLQIKIADFGFANNFDVKKQLDTFCGSPPYAAPELFQGRKYEGPEVDVWSLGVILYTLVSGSLPFDGHNMRELRERVLRGKYRIPFYMTTDCESLLKKMLIVNPLKRYTLLDVMKDKWINIGFEDNILQPFIEPKKNYEDPVRLAIMESLGFSKDEVLDSLNNAKFNNVTATYLLLDHDVNNTLENSSKSDSGSSLKNVNNLSQKDQSKYTSKAPANDTSVTRSGSALESRTNKINGDNKDSTVNDKTQHSTFCDAESNVQDSHKTKSSTKTQNSIKPSPSMGTTTTHSNDEVPQLRQGSTRSKPNAIRIPGIQPNIIAQKSTVEKPDMNNGDNLTVPTKMSTWVKRNNTFTYADKNTASEVETKPVTRTKNVMNMLSHVTPATVPLPMDQPVLYSKKHSNNDSSGKSSKKQDAGAYPAYKTSHNEIEITRTDSNCDIAIKINDRPNATGDKLCTNTLSSNDSNILLASSDENDPNLHVFFDKNTATLKSINNPIITSKEKTDIYPHLNKPKQIHTNSLFRSFTNKISSRTTAGPELNINETLSPYDNSEVSQQFRRYSTGDKLIRRLTSQNPQSNKNRQTVNEEFDHGANNDPWTPMDNVTSNNDKRKISASSDFTGDNHSSIDPNRVHQAHGMKVNQSKPRVMHLVFRKSLTSKLRPETIISEMIKSLQNSDEIDFAKIEQIDTFVIECQGKLKSEQGGNELIHWEIEVFRLPRSSSYGIRIKKQSGSSTRFKAIHKILINKLNPVLCANTIVGSN